MNLPVFLKQSSTPQSHKHARLGGFIVIVLSILALIVAPSAYALAAPSVASIDVTSGSASGGTNVTLTGTDFSAVGKTIDLLTGASGGIRILTTDGVVYRSGYGSEGRESYGGQTYDSAPVPVVTTGTPMEGKTIVAMSSNAGTTLVVDSDGAVYAWGGNTYGTLGNNSTTSSAAPVAVTTAGTPMAGKTIVDVAAGYGDHSLALASDGTLYSWGLNEQGQLGNNSTTQSLVPVAVTTAGTPMAGKTITAIAAGQAFSAALASDGTVYTWGLSLSLGNGGGSDSSVPVAVTTAGTPMAGKTITAISTMRGSVIALASDGTVYGWGWNANGNLGTGNTTDASVPVAVTTAGTPMAGKTITAIAEGEYMSAALASDGTIYTWGVNSGGGLGDGTNTDSLVPVAVTTAGTPMAGKTITQISVSGGAVSMAALASDGTLYYTGWCVGYGSPCVVTNTPRAASLGELNQASVFFGGIAASNVNFLSGTQITATAPAHASGVVDVVVVNGDGQSSTLSAAYTYDALPDVPNTGMSLLKLVSPLPILILGIASALVFIRIALKRRQG